MNVSRRGRTARRVFIGAGRIAGADVV